jgi:hypothetical protein
MACTSGRLLALLLLAACAAGEGTTEEQNSFGGPSPVPSTPMPMTGGASVTGVLTDTSGDADDTDATTRPPTSDPTLPTTGSADETGIVGTTGSADETGPVDPGTSTGPVILCGNGLIDAPEECDGVNLNAQSCQTLGFSGGTLACTPACIFDKSACTSPSCGDGTVDPGEECDCGGMGTNCSGAQLANSTCTSLPSPNGSPYAGGALACNSPASCSFNKTACTYCGDGVRNGGESCDGGDIAGQTCQGLGFSGGGALGCNGDCSFNTGGCQNIVCGDGQCQPGEDSCGCPSDCADDPNTCSPCQCGAKGGPICYCDAFCVQAGDCCIGGPC